MICLVDSRKTRGGLRENCRHADPLAAIRHIRGCIAVRRCQLIVSIPHGVMGMPIMSSVMSGVDILNRHRAIRNVMRMCR